MDTDVHVQTHIPIKTVHKVSFIIIKLPVINVSKSVEIVMNIPQMGPTLVEMPFSMDAEIATAVNLTCSAIGYPPPIYQWYKDGVIIPGETKSFLYIPETLPSDRGDYSCRAYNSIGQISSTSARVNISGTITVISVCCIISQ